MDGSLYDAFLTNLSSPWTLLTLVIFLAVAIKNRPTTDTRKTTSVSNIRSNTRTTGSTLPANLKLGSKVQIHSLVSRTDLNGLWGTNKGYNATTNWIAEPVQKNSISKRLFEEIVGIQPHNISMLKH